MKLMDQMYMRSKLASKEEYWYSFGVPVHDNPTYNFEHYNYRIDAVVYESDCAEWG